MSSLENGSVDLVSSLLATEDPLEEFKERLAAAVKAYVLADVKRAPYMYEDTATIELDNLDTDEVDKLVFGKGFEVEDRWQESASENSLSDQDDETVRDAIKHLLSTDLEDQFQALVTHLDEDEDQVRDDLLEDDSLSYYQLELQVHSVEFKYRGVKLATAELCAFNLDPKSDDLFEGLIRLQVGLDVFLEEARKTIESQCDDNGALSDTEIKTWGMEGLDDEESSMSWSEQYVSLVEDYHSAFVRRSDRSARSTLGNGVISAEDMIEMARDSWGSLTFYAHVAVGNEAISEFGMPAARFGTPERSDFSVKVRSGWIAKDTNAADTLPEAAAIRSPIEIVATGFRIQKESPCSRDEDTLSFSDRDEAMILLSERVTQKRTHGSYSVPMDATNAEDLAALEAGVKVLEDVPWWSARLALDSQKHLEHPMLRQVVNRAYSPAQQDLLDAYFAKCVREFSPTERDATQLSFATQHLHALLDIGARSDIRDAAGTTALDWASRNLVSIDVFRRLVRPPDEEASSTNPLSRCVTTLARAIGFDGTDTPRSLAGRENFALLMDAGHRMPDPDLKIVDSSPFGQLLKIDDAAMMERALSAYAAVDEAGHRDFCTALLRRSVNDLRANVAAVAIEQGADMDAAQVELGLETKKKEIEARSYGIELSMERLDRFTNVIRACRAREAATSSLRELGLSL